MPYANLDDRRAYARARYAANIEAERARGRVKAKARRARAREVQRAWRIANPMKYAAQIARRDPERQRAANRRYAQMHPEKAREKHLQRAHGMTEAEYVALAEAQGGVCAICGQPPPNGERLHVDHDHKTMKRRGLLCRSCNNGLGLLEDDPGRLRAAADYVERSTQ